MILLITNFLKYGESKIFINSLQAVRTVRWLLLTVRTR